MKTRIRPLALLLMSVEEVPAKLHQKLEKLVTPIWKPEGIQDLTQQSIESTADILVTGNTQLDGVMLERLPNLKLIVATGTAYDYIDLHYCKWNNITICNTPRYTGSSVSEHAIALLLNANRHICALNAMAREGLDDTSAFLGYELSGKSAGIIGLGDIGSRIAQIAHCFGMDVIFVNRSPKIFPNATQVNLNELLSCADVIFLSLPLTSETHHLLDVEQFSMMKRTAYVINISADELINPNALGTALQHRWIKGAALDVIGSPKPYINMPNLIITPTHGWYTAECVSRRAETWIGTIDAYLADEPRNNVIDL